MSKENFDRLLARAHTLSDLYGAMSLLSWDMHTHMPKNGAMVRAERLATLTSIQHNMLIADETGELIAGSEDYAREQGDPSFEYALWRESKRAYDHATLIPTELQAEISRAHALGNQAWMDARANSDYAAFKPYLEKNYGYTRQVLELTRSLYPDAEDDYDILLDDYERGMKTADVAAVFDAFKEGAKPLVEKIAAHQGDGRDKLVYQNFPKLDQEKLGLEVLKAVGFNDDSWDLTSTTHPFASSMAIDDIRITTRYYEDFFNPAFFGSMHEFGHGLYEHQIDKKYDRTMLASGVSMAWHESQSRMWENLVGRSLPFWKWAMPKAAEIFACQLGDASPEEMYRAVNTMGPSLIRVEADELTYNFHIIVRFELERELLAGTLSFDDLPAAWNQKMKDYLGVDVPNDAEGVLQDVHWSFGSVGYFPTYALGNFLGAMLWEKIQSDLPNLEADIESGEFTPLRTWLRENVHQYGSEILPADLMEKVLGTRKLEAQPLLNYLTAKVNELYG